jgi:heat shock protein HslJ
MKTGIFICMIYFLQGIYPSLNKLDETFWNLSSVINPEFKQIADTSCRSTLNFYQNGNYDGYSGCNSFSGKYSINENGNLTMNNPIATKRGCSGPCLLGEDLMGTFRKINKFILFEDSLILTTDSIKIVYLKK